MPLYNRPSTCLPTSDIKRFQNITINAFQYRDNGILSLNWNDPSQYILADHTGANSTPYTGTTLPKIALPVGNNFEYYANVNNSGQVFGSSQGRTWPGEFQEAQSFNNNYAINDWKYIVASSPTIGKTFTYAITDGTNVSTFTGAITVANTPQVFMWKPNVIGLQASTPRALGGTTTGAALTSPSTKETLGATATGSITIFASYVSSLQSNFPGSIYSGSICCLEEISKDNTQDKNDRTCAGLVTGTVITKETSKYTLKVKELDLQSLLIFTGATAKFAPTTISKLAGSGILPTGNGNVTFNIGANRTITKIEVGSEVLALVLSTNILDYNQAAYDSTSGNITVSGSKYGGKRITVYAGSSDTRLVASKKSLSSGYYVYCEIPEKLEDGSTRTIAFNGQIDTFTSDFVTDNDTEYSVDIIELPDLDGNYNTIIE